MWEYYRQLMYISISALLANRARSFLTMLGIIIGTAAVIIIISAGSGAQGLILGQIKGLGADLISITPGRSDDDGPPVSVMGVVITTLTYDDLRAIQTKHVPGLASATGFVKGVGAVTWQSNSYNTNLTGSSAEYLDTEGGNLLAGRFFNAEEEASLARVVVLGSVVKEEVFGDSDAVGKKVKIKNNIFEVIGVMAERGNIAFQNYDDQVFIPLRTLQKTVLGINHLNYIRAKLAEGEAVEPLIMGIEDILRDQHNISDFSGQEDDFTVRALAEALDALGTVTDALRYFLAAMAAISLLVGGIGIMNIMLINVAERTREIGLRKAVGANNRHIVVQFLLESIFVTLLGGLVGIIVGILISWLVALVIQFLGYSWDFVISIWSILLAVSIVTLIGLVFGIYPAVRASRLEPTEALRYE